MIAVDTNILVHAFDRGSTEHERAAAAVGELVLGRSWGLPWPVPYEFLAVVTRGGANRRTAPLEVAIAALDGWLASPGVHLLGEGSDHWPRVRSILTAARASGALVYDARIAALCLAHGIAELWTADRDFGRFPRLRIRNPLVG